MVEVCVRAIKEWHGGGGARAQRRSATMVRHAVASLGHGEGEREAEQDELERVRRGTSVRPPCGVRGPTPVGHDAHARRRFSPSDSATLSF